MNITDKTLIMGVVNVTPDSFSDGGMYLDIKKAVQYAEYLVKCGADIIDIGGESTRPFSNPVSKVEELNRVIPVIELLSKKVSIPISIDTMKSYVAEEALKAGASIVNDVSALSFDSKMIHVIKKYQSGVVLVHMRGLPIDMQVKADYKNLLYEINLFLSNAISNAVNFGIDKSSIVIDPGIGFGKRMVHNFKIINNLNCFSKLKVPILIGTSRKKFIRKTLKKIIYKKADPLSPYIENGTQATITASVLKGASIVRVHDVLSTKITLKIIDTLKNA